MILINHIFFIKFPLKQGNKEKTSYDYNRGEKSMNLIIRLKKF